MKLLSTSRLSAGLVAAAMIVAACGGSDATTAPVTDASSDTTASAATDPPATDAPIETDPPIDEPPIADEAYTIDLGDGISVEVAAGERADVTAVLTESPDGFTIDLQPDGAEFDTGVRIVLPVAVPDDGGAVIIEAHLTSGDGTDYVLEPEFVDDELHLVTNHFSTLVVERFRLRELIADVDDMYLNIGERVRLEVDRWDMTPAFAEEWDLFLTEGWATLDMSNNLLAVHDVATATVECREVGLESVVLRKAVWEPEGVGTRAAMATARIACIEVPTRVTSEQISMTQEHDLIPQVLRDSGAFSAIFAGLANGDPFTSALAGYLLFLIYDGNDSGTIDPADQVSFDPMPVDPEGPTGLPIDRGGQYFLALIPVDLAGQVGAGSTINASTSDLGAGWVAFDGVEEPVAVVTSPEGDANAYWNVDFGDPVMPAQP